MPFPARPAEDQDPWYATRETYDAAIEAAIDAEHDSAGVHDPAHVVKMSGNQTVAGIKTFSSIPVLPASDPTTGNQAARKAYVDAIAGGASPLTTKGDVYTRDASADNRLPVGADGYALRARSGEDTGLEWSGDDHLPYFEFNGGTGWSTRSHGWASGTSTQPLTVDRLLWATCRVPRNVSVIGQVRINVTTASAAGGIARIGLFTIADNGVITLLRDCGTVAIDSTGDKSITGLAQAVEQGTILLAGVVASLAVSIRCTNSGHQGYAQLGFNNGNIGLALYINSAGTGAFNASYGPSFLVITDILPQVVFFNS